MRKLKNKSTKDKKKLQVFLKNLKKQKNKKPQIEKVKQEVIYTYENGFYPKGTDMSELARNFINEYKLLHEKKEALKRNTMSGEEYLRGKHKNTL